MKRFRGIIALALLLGGNHLWAQSNPNGVIPLHNVNDPYLFLVRDPVVHRDLKLTATQQQKLNAVNDDVDMIMWSRRNKGEQYVVKATAEAKTKTQRQLASFLSEQQTKRVDQIALWVLGMKSLLRDDVAQQVGLDSSQRSDIREIVVNTQKAIAKLREQLNNGGDAELLNGEFRRVQTDQQKDVVAILTDEQKQLWLATLGQRIDVSKLGRIKFKAPELLISAGWVNSPPLTLDKLKGKVVALHFYAFA